MSLSRMARAFVKDPELLILDEPLHGLDNRNRRLVKEEPKPILKVIIRPGRRNENENEKEFGNERN